jgi:hypothetical protein
MSFVKAVRRRSLPAPHARARAPRVRDVRAWCDRRAVRPYAAEHRHGERISPEALLSSDPFHDSNRFGGRRRKRSRLRLVDGRSCGDDTDREED